MLPGKTRYFKFLFSRIKPCITNIHNTNNKIIGTGINILFSRRKSDGDVKQKSLFQPLSVKVHSDDINVGAELTKPLKKPDILQVLNLFKQKQEMQTLASEYGLDNYLWNESVTSFRQYCVEAETLPVDLHIVISDILQGAGHLSDIFPYFMRHAKQIFPHIDCMDDLKKISDLRTPANWYPVARTITRKIIFHVGPTNSGKTYHALERFMAAKSGIYCGPLKLLAAEVFQKSNAGGTPCDLITGEERQYSKDADHPASHTACTIEMVDLNSQYEVGIIDEIQLLQDLGRGWAWTRALLGVAANEIHVCGEASAIDLVQALCSTTGETVEIRKYKRLTELSIEDTAVVSLNNIQPGDCIVCFSKNDIYFITRKLEQRNIDVAVIYGSLPPKTKLSQAAKFNDINDPCKVLVATDAIGLGLNLHIRRVIFYSLIKPMINENGEREMNTISVSTALQIAGRAGRYGTQWEKGYVTTFKSEDLPSLKMLLSQTPEPIKQAGLHPTADQIELYAYHLPKAPLSNLIDIFVSMSTVDDSMYFICNINDFKFLADMIEHVPLPLRARYVFCCAPINRKLPFVCTMFLKFARQFYKNEPITFNWLCLHIGWPLSPPKTLIDLVHLEAVFDVLDLYLWLSYRFKDLFPDVTIVQDMQTELDAVIRECIIKLTKLIKNSESDISSAAATAIDEENFQLNARKNNYLRETSVHKSNTKTPYSGKLTDRLLSQGLLTPGMLQELQHEWSQNVKKNENSTNQKSSSLTRKITRKRK